MYIGFGTICSFKHPLWVLDKEELLYFPQDLGCGLAGICKVYSYHGYHKVHEEMLLASCDWPGRSTEERSSTHGLHQNGLVLNHWFCPGHSSPSPECLASGPGELLYAMLPKTRGLGKN